MSSARRTSPSTLQAEASQAAAASTCYADQTREAREVLYVRTKDAPGHTQQVIAEEHHARRAAQDNLARRL